MVSSPLISWKFKGEGNTWHYSRPAKKKNRSVGDEDFGLIIGLCCTASATGSQWRDGCKQRRLQSIKLPLRACQTDNSWKKLTLQIHQPTCCFSLQKTNGLTVAVSAASPCPAHFRQLLAWFFILLPFQPAKRISTQKSKEHARQVILCLEKTLRFCLDKEAFLNKQTDEAKLVSREIYCNAGLEGGNGENKYQTGSVKEHWNSNS